MIINIAFLCKYFHGISKAAMVYVNISISKWNKKLHKKLIFVQLDTIE